MKIAVLGASGFVGGHILRGLRDAGIQARAVIRNRQLLVNDPDRRIADACDVFALRTAFAGCDCVVHAALGSEDVILDSLAPVYAAAEGVGARRLVYISTGSVHGQAPAPGTDETSPLSVRHSFSYNNAKVRAERKLLRLRSRGAVELVLLRPTIVFGPGSRWVYDFADALRNGTAYLVDGARGICNSIYVDNLVYAVRLALTVDGADGEAFLVSDAETVTWRDLYQPIAEAFGVDLDLVLSISPPIPPRTFQQLYVDPIRMSEAGQTIIKCLPPRLKSTIKAPFRAARRLKARVRTNPGVGSGVTSLSSPLVVSPEIAALHRCRWRLPNDKAARILGYAPPVSFTEGCRLSVEWLKQRLAQTA